MTSDSDFTFVFTLASVLAFVGFIIGYKRIASNPVGDTLFYRMLGSVAGVAMGASIGFLIGFGLMFIPFFVIGFVTATVTFFVLEMLNRRSIATKLKADIAARHLKNVMGNEDIYD